MESQVDEPAQRSSLTGPGGASVSFLVEAKRSGTLSWTPAREPARTRLDDRPAVVSDCIGPRLREALAAEGISYAGATGWVCMTSDVPLILFTRTGEQ